MRGEREKINVITGYSTSKDCTGVLNLTVCSLESAIGEYDVTIADDVTTLDSPANPRIVALSNNALTDHSINENGYHPSTLGGIVAQAYMRWEGNAKYVNISGTIQTITLNGSPSLFMEAQQPTLCRDFRDPLEEYMASINTLMVSERTPRVFRIAHGDACNLAVMLSKLLFAPAERAPLPKRVMRKRIYVHLFCCLTPSLTFRSAP